MNIDWSRKILTELNQQTGVCEFVFCAGARNSPLVVALAAGTGLDFKLHSFFEERSAAFFAMGIARRTGRPVAVVTTSGTAVANLLPATIESFHTGVPLILVTADRPKRLRGTGAPQAIDQTGMFTKFTDAEFDLENGGLFDLAGWNKRAPIHINICFDEPLIDSPVHEFKVTAPAASFKADLGADESAALEKFVNRDGAMIAVVGTLENESERAAVAQLIRHLKLPAYVEATSGLREHPELQPFVLRSGDKLLSWALKRNLFTKVLRLGGVPTVRIWRDLEEPKSQTDVFSLSLLPFAGLSRGEFKQASVAKTLMSLMSSVARVERMSEHGQKMLEKDRAVESLTPTLMKQEPRSEPSLVHALSKLIPQNALVYVGNSLPIREWDFAATYATGAAGARKVEANRGVNGIDGQLSTFYGLSHERRENWAVLGDLTTMYDLSGPWALRCREGIQTRLVIINNGGGKIFDRIFGHSLFENAHALEFENWARMWKLEYQRFESVPPSTHFGDHAVLEIVPDNDATKRFWDAFEKSWA